MNHTLYILLCCYHFSTHMCCSLREELPETKNLTESKAGMLIERADYSLRDLHQRSCNVILYGILLKVMGQNTITIS